MRYRARCFPFNNKKTLTDLFFTSASCCDFNRLRTFEYDHFRQEADVRNTCGGAPLLMSPKYNVCTLLPNIRGLFILSILGIDHEFATPSLTLGQVCR